jgi:hypothetical protein
VKRGAACIVALATLLPRPAAAQCGGFLEEPCPLDAPRWVGEFTTLTANALLGGLTAGLIQELRGGSFTPAFVRGALGGAGVYAGKKIAAERFGGAGLIGREVAAIGSSVIRNASDDLAVFERLILPVGPVRFYVMPSAGSVRARIDLITLGWTVYGVVEDEVEIDWSESFSAGAPVFATRGTVIEGTHDGQTTGITASGIIIVAGVPAFGESHRRRALAHERVHVLQGDHIFTTWTDPLEDVVLPLLPGGVHLDRFADIGLSTDVLSLLVPLIPERNDRPWELESTFLAR